MPLPHAELAELDALRLDRDWTWAELSAAMDARGVEMSPRTLHYLLKRAPAQAQPLDRTLHKIRTYLATVKADARRRARRRKAKITTSAEA